MNTIVVYLIAALGGLSLLGGAYVKGRSDGEDHCEAAKDRDERVAAIAGDAAASAAAGAIAKIQIKQTTIRQQAQTEIRHEPVYMDCSHSPDVRRLLDAALANRVAASGPNAGASGVPAAEPTR